MMFCQKEEIDHVLGNHKGARDHLVSSELRETQAAQARCTICRLRMGKYTLSL